MRDSIKSILCLLPCLLLVFSLLTACGDSDDTLSPHEPDMEPVVIEPGLPERDDDGDSPEQPPKIDNPEDFPDPGAEATLESVSEALFKIKSYYFEQEMPYLNTSVFMQVWYKDGYMRMLSSMDGYMLSENFYDYNQGTITIYSAVSGGPAQRMSFDFSSDEAPQNPVMEDYSLCTLLGSEEINGQICLILETPTGDKLWVGTQYGFPLQVEFTDSLGDRFVSSYNNIRINTLEDADVQPPAQMEIENVGNI